MARLLSSIAFCYKARQRGLKPLINTLKRELERRNGRKIKAVRVRDYSPVHVWQQVDRQLEREPRVLIFAFTEDGFKDFREQVSRDETEWYENREERRVAAISVVQDLGGASKDWQAPPLFDRTVHFQHVGAGFRASDLEAANEVIEFAKLASGEHFRPRKLLPMEEVIPPLEDMVQKLEYPLPGGALEYSVERRNVSLPQFSPLEAPSEGAKFYPVWFATNREWSPLSQSFTNDRSSRLTWGKIDVSIPKGHRFGEIGTGWLRKILRRDFTDDTLKIAETRILDEMLWFIGLRNNLDVARRMDGEAHGVVYIHGFNVSFEEAALRAAQLGYDLKVPGATAFFSWPSHGKLLSYLADAATIEASEPLLTEFLVRFARESGADKIHIIAHSMGNRGLLRSFQRIVANAEAQADVKIGELILAAPDVDRDLFLELCHLYHHLAERTTLYTSSRDLAVWVSQLLHWAPRAGYFKPYTVKDGLDTIAVPNFNVDLLGHGYFAQAEALLYDIRNIMLSGRPPQRRQRIERFEDNGVTLWRFER